MPVSVETFNNYLKSHMRDEWNKTRAVAIRNELVRRGVTEVREKKIIWEKAKRRIKHEVSQLYSDKNSPRCGCGAKGAEKGN